jgi:hypothetical protein
MHIPGYLIRPHVYNLNFAVLPQDMVNLAKLRTEINYDSVTNICSLFFTGRIKSYVSY